MRFFKLFVPIILLLCAVRLASWGAAIDREPNPTPMMRTVNPETVKAGDIATVSGEYLDKSRVAEVYLTNGTVDIKVQILEQTDSAIKFKVPEKAQPGRYHLMVLMTDEPPKLIEEPARLTVVGEVTAD